MGQTHFGVYHSPASLVLCISQRPPRENGSLSLWWGNAKHLSTRFCCTRSRTCHGRKEKQEPLAGAAGGITGCRVRLRQGNTLTALMTLVAARTLAALQVASVPRAVRRASMARAYAAFDFAPSFAWTRIMGSDFARLPGRSGNTVVHENRPQVNSTCSEVPTSQNSKCPPTPPSPVGLDAGPWGTEASHTG